MARQSRKRDAEAKLIELGGQVQSGTFRPDATKVTVTDACAAYLNHLEMRAKRGARVTQSYLATTRAELWYVDPRQEDDGKRRNRRTSFDDGIGHVRLSQLTASVVGDLRDKLLASGLSVTGTRRSIAALGRALSYAVERDLIAMNVAKGVKVIGRRSDGPKKIKPPSKVTLEALRSAADGDTRIRIWFAASTGLRASEQWALRWGDIDLDARSLTVERRLDRYGKEDTTKSTAGQRKVPISRQLASELTRMRGTAADDSLVFPNASGGYTQHSNFVRRGFARAISAAGEGPMNWHALRHFAISTWIEDGLPPKGVQTFAGHASLAITMDRYGHLFPSDDHLEAMDRIADRLGWRMDGAGGS
jgi:integrase